MDLTSETLLKFEQNDYILQRGDEECALRAITYLMTAAENYVQYGLDNAPFETHARFAIAVQAVAETITPPNSTADERLSHISAAAISLASLELFGEDASPNLVVPEEGMIKRMKFLGYSRIINRRGSFIPLNNSVQALDVMDLLYVDQLRFIQDHQVNS